MYNRYIRNDRGTYTRITEDDGTPRRPSNTPAPPNPQPPPSGRPPEPPPPPPSGRPPEPPLDAPPSGRPPDASEPPPLHRPHPDMPPHRPPGFLRHLLDDMDTGDLLLLCLLFLLYRESADEELLVALGLLLIL